MSDLGFLYLVLVGLYVAECFEWVTNNQTLLVWRPWSGYVPGIPIPFLRNERGGLTFTCLLPPVMPAFTLRGSLRLPLATRQPTPQEKDRETLTSVFNSLQTRLRWLNLTSTIYCSYLLFVVPVAVSYYGLQVVAFPVLAGISVLAVANATAFAAVHYVYWPRSHAARIGHTVKILLYPPSAMRATDIIARRLLQSFHPLLVASELCRVGTFDNVRIEFSRALVYPTAAERPARVDGETIENLSQQITEFADEVFAARHSSVIMSLREDLPDEDDGVCYCPRCLACFSQPMGECPDCVGVQTTPVPNSTSLNPRTS